MAAMITDKKTLVKAKALTEAISRELKRGTKHFNHAGKELTTIKEILTTLITEGQIQFQPPSN